MFSSESVLSLTAIALLIVSAPILLAFVYWMYNQLD